MCLYPKQTPNEFWTEYTSILNQLDYPEDEAITQARYVYDAVWMIALTLNQSIADLEDRLNLTLNDFSYDPDSYNITKIFIERMSNLTFCGVSVSKVFLSVQWQIQGTGVKSK